MTAESIVLGYIEAYDPDILVQCTPSLPSYLQRKNIQIIRPTDIWQSLERDQSTLAPNFGIGIFEILDDIYQKHFRYIERFPVRVDISVIPRQRELFWSALFGQLPERVHKIAVERYEKALALKTPPINLGTLSSLLAGNTLYPMLFTQHAVDVHPRGRGWRDATVYYLDITSVQDVIDYWNLRALGRTVLAMPWQLDQESAFRKAVTNLVEAVYRPLKHNPKVYHTTCFICSTGSDLSRMQTFVKSITRELRLKLDPDNFPVVLDRHYPRIWDDWARDKDDADPCDTVYQQTTLDFNDVAGRVNFACIAPSFMSGWNGHEKYKCANEIEFRFYDSKDYTARTLPRDGGENVDRVVSGTALYRHDCRIGRNGLVRLERHFFSEPWRVLHAQEVLFAWLQDKGWQVELSTAGLIAKHLFAQLDGDLQPLSDFDLLRLLEDMNSGRNNEREKEVGEIRNRLKNFTTSADLHQFLLAKQVFRLVSCPRYILHN
jgi:hypothetical protein